jgi:ABC-type transport system involved in cytochrome c biogenesis ATPase subunit
MIALRFKSEYKSVKDLPDCELPDLVVLTGVNGCGKTHLLESIANLTVSVNGIKNKNQVRSYNWTNFTPQIEEAGSPHSSFQNRQNAISQVLKSLKSSQAAICGHFAKRKIEGNELLGDLTWLLSCDQSKMISVLSKCTVQGRPLALNFQPAFQQFDTFRTKALLDFETQIRGFGELAKKLDEIAVRRKCSILEITAVDIEDSMPLFWSQGNILNLKLAEWFVAWHDAHEINGYNRYRDQAEKVHGLRWLSEEDFRRKHGPEPWDLTNRVLDYAGVRYRFNRPEGGAHAFHANFQLRLTDPESDTVIQLQDLSSGEKVILAITMLLYQTTEHAIMADLPKLLLLDEVDAPLHPSFTKVLLKVLQEEFVGRCGISVILSTHSPSTVALAPSGSVYELIRRPRSLRPVTPSIAAQVLSDGYIALAPNDIMVITESGADVGYYGVIYKSLCDRGMIYETPSLKFIPASNSVRDRANGGCTQVRNWAPKLASLGFDRFKGLVDMDSGVSGDSVITVLSRYSWENYLFDPITLIAYILHRGFALPFSDLGTGIKTAADVVNLSQATIEALVIEFSKWVESEAEIQIVRSGTGAKCSYLQWEEISLPAWYITERGHDLEKHIRGALNNYSKGSGPLVKKDEYRELLHLQANVAPQLISKDLVGILESLMSLPGTVENSALVASVGDAASEIDTFIASPPS